MKLEHIIEACDSNPRASVIEYTEHGEVVELNFEELARAAKCLSERLVDGGLLAGHTVAILSTNSIEWIIWDLAVAKCNGHLLALPEVEDNDDLHKIIMDQMPALIVTDNIQRFSGLDFSGALISIGSEEHGIKISKNARRTENSDIHSFVFSSGTTGRQKGLIISKSGTGAVINAFVTDYELSYDDKHVIFLPLSNYQQRLSVYGCIVAGASIVLSPYQKVFSVVKEQSPTFIIAPPVFYNNLDKLFNKDPGDGRLKTELGDSIRFCITGMAPIRKETIDRFWDAGVKLFEAYGMTESGMNCWNTPGAYKIGTVGKAVPGTSIHLAEDGEVIVSREYPLSLGYFTKHNEEDSQVFGPGGIINTGDYGHIDNDGFLTLDGRKKDIIATPSGKKFHPLEVETILQSRLEVQDAIVISDRGTNVAIIKKHPHDNRDDLQTKENLKVINGALDYHKRVGRLVFTEVDIKNDARFMTKNMKLNRLKVREHFLKSEA